MTGTEMVKQVLALLGFQDDRGEITAVQRLKAVALAAVNTVYADLYFHSDFKNRFAPLRTLTERINLDQRTVYDVMPYGVAAYFALSLGDGEQQQIFSAMYNAKRAAGGRQTAVCDILPVTRD